MKEGCAWIPKGQPQHTPEQHDTEHGHDAQGCSSATAKSRQRLLFGRSHSGEELPVVGARRIVQCPVSHRCTTSVDSSSGRKPEKNKTRDLRSELHQLLRIGHHLNRSPQSKTENLPSTKKKRLRALSANCS